MVIDAFGGIAGLLLTVLLISGWVVMEFREARARKEAELERAHQSLVLMLRRIKDPPRDARGRFTRRP